MPPRNIQMRCTAYFWEPFAELFPEAGTGHVNEEDPSWQAWSQEVGRPADCRQESSSESHSQNQMNWQNTWKVICRGDRLTSRVKNNWRVTVKGYGRRLDLNVTSVQVIQHVPQYIEFTGVEVQSCEP